MRFSAVVAFVVFACACGGGSSSGPSEVNVRGSKSLFFDGADDLVTIAMPGYFTVTNGFTLEAWIFPPVLSSHAGSAGIVGAGPHELTQSGNIGDTNSTGLLQFVATPASGVAESPHGTLKAGVWQHVAGTYDGSTVRVYHDGVLVGSMSHAGVPTAFSTVILGRSGLTFYGAIDEVRIWDHARTQSEIAGAMNTALSGHEAGLLAYYRFEGAGQTVTDSSAGGADGVLGEDSSAEGSDPVRQAN